ncbi:MAG: VPLPA-CTERM sorting domain-containing protein [Pseudomonadota bacterium]
MKLKLVHLTSLAIAACISVSAATAATFGFALSDHPGGGMSHTYDYGLRLDRENPDRFFSFGNGASAYMFYDDDNGGANTRAILFGTMRESLGNGNDGGLFNFAYEMLGVTNTGTGTFTDYSGTGNGFVFGAGAGGSDLALGSAARGDGAYFLFGEEITSHNQGNASYEGAGWVQKGPGANDFLFTAEQSIIPVPPDSVSPVPLPAASWMLIAGLGGLAAMGRRRRS